MNKYDEVKELIDRYKGKIADDFDNIDDYYLIIRIEQMYRELKQVKLSYERVLKTEKGELIRAMVQARQSLYNARSGRLTKQDLIDGINYAIKDLNEILVLEKLEEK